jgi:hypothetical protein
MKFGDMTNLFILFFILTVLGFLYRRYEDKLMREENKDNYDAIQKYLLDDVALGKSKKPILWIYVPYEYNSRNWSSFGSRSSLDLNQPYLYLTVRSIIKKCEESFTICIFDDSSFKKLLPSWDINLKTISDPILSNMRLLGMMKLLYTYGGIMCPISFLCMKDLMPLYTKGIRGNKMFVCETIDRNYTSSTNNFYPTVYFSGAPKECQTVAELCNYIQTITSHDCTAESKFLGQYDRWCMKKVKDGKMNIIDGVEIGTKTINDKQIILDDLMSNHHLDLYQHAYGILIPSNELLKRVYFGWFVRMSAKQVLESDTILGNYFLLSIGPEKEQGIIQPLEPEINKTIENKFVSFWKVPSGAPLWSLKPNYLGNNLQKIAYPQE